MMSNTKAHLREISETPFEHFCDVLNGTDEIDGFNNHQMKCGECIMRKRRFLVHQLFRYISIKKYADFCITCNHTNKDNYNSFVTNITNKYKLEKNKNFWKSYTKLF